jgi:hypothetical protein
MKPVNIILTVLMLLFHQDLLKAQLISKSNFSFGVTAGVGKYSQSDLKEINSKMANQLIFETKLVNDFPPTFFWGVHFAYQMSPRLFWGPDYQFHTTGSRLGYRDYSGSYSYDQILSCNSIAVKVENLLFKKGVTSFGLCMTGGINLSGWKIIEKVTIGKQTESSLTKLFAARPFIYPSIRLKHSFLDFLSVSAASGYSIDLGGKYRIKNNGRTTSDFVASWSGPRLEINFDYSF